jgi:microsomal dipeptidase-like Zn-dependent dipeptidase
MTRRVAALVPILVALACNSDDTSASGSSTGTTDVAPTTTTMPTTGGTADETGTPGMLDIDGLANGCWTVHAPDGVLARAGETYAIAADGATHFTLRASDLGTFLFYDEEGGYLVAEDGPLVRQTTLQSDVTLVDDTYISGAEWIVEPSATDPMTHAVLRNRRTGQLLGATGLVADDAQGIAVTFESATDCREYPELSLDATGMITRTTFDDGTLYGIVDAHSHILSNFAFGGGGIFHGGAYHRLGVEHALPDCELYHGEMGRKDFFGYAFDSAGADGADIAGLLPDIIAGELSVDSHITAGYPEFTDWPNGPSRSTHQTQYYKWLERAYLAGLRLVVQHATTNSVICNMIAGAELQPVRYACDDMVAVDRIIDETYALERYIDAQSGGEGLGWFRVVQTPAQAREVIEGGKMAVVLGIETSDLFDCRITPYPGGVECDEAYVTEQLDAYYERGVRAIFPVHKYDNAFSPGDGDRAFIELGNFFNSGHWSNFTLECPPDVPARFDQGDVSFGGLNMPRDEYDSPAAHDFSNFPSSPLATAFPFVSSFDEPPLVGPYCQNATMTPLGETLMREMMTRGMIIEVDHLPQYSYERAYELLEENDYPAAGTHGGNWDGRLYALGGISKMNLGRCREAMPGAMTQGLLDRVALIEKSGGYPAEGFGFDLNGFAGAPGPRFADGACATPQEDPITYPFTSFGGDVEFTEPSVGNRVLDFNQEGLVHIGLLPELLEDARRDATSDADLEPVFRSAEGWIRMWEKAEARAAALK